MIVLTSDSKKPQRGLEIDPEHLKKAEGVRLQKKFLP
jgi:hypothetical protein